MAGLDGVPGFAKKYFGVQTARREAAANQPVYDKPIRKEGLREAVQRYALTEFSRFAPASLGYDAARTNGSRDSLVGVLKKGTSLDTKLYDANESLAKSMHANYLEPNSIDSLITIDPSPKLYGIDRSNTPDYGASQNGALNRYLN